MSYPISEIQEIGPTMAERLKAQRIRTTAKLLERTKNVRGRQKLSAKIGEVLVATASGLFIAIPAFFGYYFLRNRAAGVLHDIQDTLAGLFRKMPYEKLHGIHLGDEELYAADPEWWTGDEPEAATT